MGEAKRKEAARRAGINLPDRKFMSEFAVNIFSARWIMITPHQLMSNEKIPKEYNDLLSRCHIYLICRRPMQSIDPAIMKYNGDVLTGDVIYREKGIASRVSFSHPFQLVDGATKIEIPYPHREIQTTNSDGNVIRYFPVSALSIVVPLKDRALREFEVLYVGQAYVDGNRNAFDRLRSHSTLQKILARTHYELPDDEIQIFAFEYAPYRIIASYDGIDKTGIRDHRDDARFPNILKNPLSEKQQICLVEAGLIRYFQPYYNTVYKESFPASDQKILDSCYNVDFSALIIEINTDELSLYLRSPTVVAQQHRIAKYDLVDSDKRRSFFTFVDHTGDAFDVPGVIPPSR